MKKNKMIVLISFCIILFTVLFLSCQQESPVSIQNERTSLQRDDDGIFAIQTTWCTNNQPAYGCHVYIYAEDGGINPVARKDMNGDDNFVLFNDSDFESGYCENGSYRAWCWTNVGQLGEGGTSFQFQRHT